MQVSHLNIQQQNAFLAFLRLAASRLMPKCACWQRAASVCSETLS